MEVKIKTYENGLRLVFEKNNKDVVATNILFYVGSCNETQDEEGLSHLIEHMIFKSSKKFTTEQIMDKLTFFGADFNAYTSKTTTRFVFKCLSQNFESCFEIYADMILHPLFLDEELKKEKNVVVEEMKKYEDEPVEVMFQRTIKNYFSGTSYAHDVLGREEVIENVSREKLFEYKNRFYKPENAIISVSGNLDFDELDKVIQKYFASEFNYEASPVQTNFSEFLPNISSKYDIVSRNDSQANVCINIKSVTFKSDLKYIADLYTCILGNSQNSRLYKTIREELGLVYTVYAYNEIGARTGEIFIIFGTRPKNVSLAVSKVREIIDDLAKNGVDETELTRAKNWKISCIEYGTETNSDIAEINGTSVLFENFAKTNQERKKHYESVTAESVNDFAKKIASEKTFNVVGVGKDFSIQDLKNF